MVQSTIEYTGELGCTATHGPSGNTVKTDAPKDNKGKGESFSPTDLVATALGSCMLTIMGITARRLSIDMRGATAVVDKEMAANPDRKIGQLAVKISVPVAVSDTDRAKLERAAYTCPVHQSLHPEIAIPVIFAWG